MCGFSDGYLICVFWLILVCCSVVLVWLLLDCWERRMMYWLCWMWNHVVLYWGWVLMYGLVLLCESVCVLLELWWSVVGGFWFFFIFCVMVVWWVVCSMWVVWVVLVVVWFWLLCGDWCLDVWWGWLFGVWWICWNLVGLYWEIGWIGLECVIWWVIF